MNTILSIAVIASPFVALLISYFQYRDGHRTTKRLRKERIERISEDILVCCGLAYRNENTGTIHIKVSGINAESRFAGARAKVQKRLSEEV